MHAASGKLASLPVSGDPIAQSVQIATYMKTQPNVSRAVANQGCVTVTMTDGSHFGVICNRQPTESQVRSASLPADSRAALELPGSRDAIIMNPLGEGFFDISDRLLNMVNKAGYTGRKLSPTLETLKALGSAGIVYYESHGGTMNGQYCVWTASSVPALSLLYSKELSDMEAAGEIIAVSSTVSGDPTTGDHVTDTRWAITPLFVQKYWTGLDANSLVMIDACHSADTTMSLAAQKVCSYYIGWTDLINSGGPQVFLFDRLLGQNSYLPESPNQRPFNLNPIISDMHSRGLDTNGTTSLSRLSVTPGLKGNFGLLAPTIESMFVNEKNKTLIIDGEFGNDPGQANGQVYVGGQLMGSRSWTENEITVNNLPVSGAGASGDVYVVVRQHKSNVVQLTEWKGDLTFTYTGKGTLHVTGPITIHFRADVHDYREAPHVAPTKPVSTFDAAPDSKASWTAGGSGTINRATTTLSGSSEMTLDGSGGNVLKCLGNIDTDTKTLNLALIAASTSGMRFVTVGPLGTARGPFAMSTGKLDGNLSQSQPIPALHIKLNDNFGIPAASRQETVSNGTLLLKWSAITPTSPPASDEARSVPNTH
jgi:hypothetical protein